MSVTAVWVRRVRWCLEGFFLDGQFVGLGCEGIWDDVLGMATGWAHRLAISLRPPTLTLASVLGSLPCPHPALALLPAGPTAPADLQVGPAPDHRPGRVRPLGAQEELQTRQGLRYASAQPLTAFGGLLFGLVVWEWCPGGAVSAFPELSDKEGEEVDGEREEEEGWKTKGRTGSLGAVGLVRESAAPYETTFWKRNTVQVNSSFCKVPVFRPRSCFSHRLRAACG